MKILRLIPSLIFSLAIAATIPRASMAQNFPAPASSGRKAPSTQSKNPKINFLNAPLDEVVGALRVDFPDWNFVVAPSLAKVQLPSLELHDADLNQVLTALKIATNGRVECELSNVSENLVSLTDNLPNPVGANDDDPRVEAFSLNGYIDPGEMRQAKETKMAELKSIIDDTVNTMAQESSNPDPAQCTSRLEYYPSANLAVVVGGRVYIETAAKILCAVANHPSPIAGGTGTLPAQPQPPGPPPPPGSTP